MQGAGAPRAPASLRAMDAVPGGAQPCAFCDLRDAEVLAESELAVAVLDRHPVSDGHALIVPRRHVATWFDARDDERVALVRLLDRARERVEARLGRRPDGWNGGFNAGAAAGQTVMHLHLHLIPRWLGDVPDARGGIRGVVPERRLYL